MGNSHVLPQRLADAKKQRIQCFIAVRDEPEKVHQRLELLQQGYLAADDKSAFHYEQRMRRPLHSAVASSNGGSYHDILGEVMSPSDARRRNMC
jgi:hypothetical protein